MDTYVRVTHIDNEIQAGALAARLEAQHIPHIMQSFHDSAYDGVFQAQHGWGCVMAPATCEHQIKTIFEELLREAEAIENDAAEPAT